MDSKSSRRILDLGQDLADEDEAERQAQRLPVANPAFTFRDEEGEDEEGGAEIGDCDQEEAWASEDEEVEEVEIDPEDNETWNRLMGGGVDPSKLFDGPGDGEDDDEDGEPKGPDYLSNLILEKIAAHEAAQQGGHGQGQEPQRIQGGGAPEDAVELDAKVVEVYTQVGLLLSRYKSGKLPKPFKVLPTLPSGYHTARQLDTERRVRSNKDIHILQASSRPGILPGYLITESTRRHPRDERVERTFTQSHEKGTVQARGLLPRTAVSSRRFRDMHATRGSHYRISPFACFDTSAALRDSSLSTMRNCCGSDDARCRISRCMQHLHSHTLGEEVRTAVPRGRCTCLSLPAFPTNARSRRR